jgi:DNA-binding NtrC family response regulator
VALTPDPFVGASPFAERAREIIPELARSRETLLFVGERGTGKSFLAAHVHRESRNAHPIEVLNCAIATERACRLELFGGEPPELTTTKRSLLELPTTVVLKHIERAGPFLQDRFAESLRTRAVVRLRGEEAHEVAARLILTLRKPPGLLRKEGSLTEELGALLRRCRTLSIPPLRERPEDLLPLASYYHASFLRRLAGPRDRPAPPGLRPGLERFLRRQVWEDNVRDLVAYIRSLIVFAYEEEIIQREKLELMKMLTLLEQGNEFSLEESMAAIRRSIILRAAKRQGGHQGRTAELLGLSDREIRRKIPR